jgi:hypothetical protein
MDDTSTATAILRMCNHATVAKTVVLAHRTLAIAALTLGLGAHHTWAESSPNSVTRQKFAQCIALRQLCRSDTDCCPGTSCQWHETDPPPPASRGQFPSTCQNLLPKGSSCTKGTDCQSGRCSTFGPFNGKYVDQCE